MTKKMIALACFAFTSTLMAAQKVTVCLEAQGLAPHQFETGFVSSDIFDRGNYIDVQNGQTRCVSHIYKNGPKNLKISVKAAKKEIILFPDESCSYMEMKKTNHVESNYLRSAYAQLNWYFTLMGKEKSYTLQCEHSVNK